MSASGNRPQSRAALLVALAMVVAIAGLAVTAAKHVLPKAKNNRAICAEFTDAVGLYPGNKVTLLGIEVGQVAAVTNKVGHVQVDLTVDRDLELPADVGAVTYSQSIVTDRHVELTRPYDGGPRFTGSECITLQSTKTPIGVSETFSALGKLTDAILGPDNSRAPADAPGVQAINDSIRAAGRSLADTGPALNQMLRDLATMLGDPYKADDDYRKLFENSQILSAGFLKHWDTFRTVTATLPDTARLIEGLSDNFAGALHHLVHLLPTLVEALNRFSPRVYHNITDKLLPWIRDLLGAYTPHILGIINSWPQFSIWLSDIYEPAWGTHNVTYIPPQVAISPAQVGAICEKLQQRNTPGSSAACTPGTASDPVTLGLTDLILGAALS